MKLISKKLLIFIGLMIMLPMLFSCNKEEKIYETMQNIDPPDRKLRAEEPDLNFDEMHNFVIDSISSEVNPFFYIVDGKFDLSGDNEKKVIKITCTCKDGTIVDDLDLFLSMVLNYASINAAEQDFRFKAPTTDDEGTYMNFGNLFDTYDLEINSVDESGNVIRNDYIKAGEKIPIDPRYIKE